MRVLLVEDSSFRIEFFKKIAKKKNWELHIAKSYSKAVSFLSFLKFEEIYLDHDIVGEKTGYDVAKFIKKYKIKGAVFIHSQNVVGVENIQRTLPYATRVPFHLIEETK